MPLERFANTPTPLTPGTAWTTSAALISAVATTLSVTSHTPFPSAAQFRILVNSSAGWEWMLVTAGGGTTSWTVTRGIEGSTAYAHPAGATIQHVVTAAGLANHPRSMTTSGDFEYLNASLSPTRLAAPSNGDYVMRFASGVPSWVAATGGTPGGSTTQIQYNNAGAFGGSANLTWDGTLLTVGIVNEGPFGGAFDPDWLAHTAQFIGQTLDGTIPSNIQTFGLYVNTILDAVTGSDRSVHATTYSISTAAANAQNYATVYGNESVLVHNGSGTITNAYGSYIDAENESSGAIGSLYAFAADVLNVSTGTVDNGYGFALKSPIPYSAPGMSTLYAFYGGDLAGVATNSYYFWADSQGVYRIREDAVADTASFPQAISSLYNPRFTKYVPGAADFERSVEQWVGNVLQIGAEKGGTGTLRALQLLGASVTTPHLITTAGTTSLSSLRVPHGVAPSAPVNGDMWTTTAGLFVRINGATVGPLS